MNANGEITFGYEWETLLLNKYGLPAKPEEISPVVSELRETVPQSRVGYDWVPGLERGMLEIRSGICRNRIELENRSLSLLKKCIDVADREDFSFLAMGSFPPFGGPGGLHVHVGYWDTARDLQNIANSIYPYIPPLSALLVNSPLWGYNKQNPPFRFRSNRMRYHALTMSIPEYIDPNLSHLFWAGDVTVKFVNHPTMEIRIFDAPLSWKLLCEITALSASFLHEFCKRPEKFSMERFIEAIDNKIRIMKDGLRTKIMWKGNEKEVRDIIYKIIDISLPSLKDIGYTNLPIIERMLELRQTQSDFIEYIYKIYNRDIYEFTSYISSKMNWVNDLFSKYLGSAEELESGNLLDIEEYLLSMIGNKTQYGSLFRILYQPVSIFESRLDKKVLDAKVKKMFDIEKGTLFTRIKKEPDP